jgi:hypothetical protein
MHEARWVDRLERSWGSFSIPGLASFLAGITAAVGLLSLIRPDFPGQLYLEPELVLAGEVWRVVTFLFIPPENSPLWLILWVLVFYSIQKHLEDYWGDFKLTVYWTLGVAATTAASLASGWPMLNGSLLFSAFLAFARLNPRHTFFLFFVLPIEARWLAAGSAALAAWRFAVDGPGGRLALLSGLVNYLLFFGPGHWQDLKRMLRK